MSESVNQTPPVEDVRLREIVEAKRRTFSPLDDSYDEGFDDALCWVLDQLDQLHLDRSEEP